MILQPRCFFAKFAASVTLDGVSPTRMQVPPCMCMPGVVVSIPPLLTSSVVKGADQETVWSAVGHVP